MKKYSFIFFIFFIILFFIRELIVSYEKSLTCDETVHIPAGYFYVKKGDFFINFEHPPFSKILSGLFISKLKILLPENSYSVLREREWDLGLVFFYNNRENVDKILFLARFPMILLGILLGFFIYLWSKDLYGDFAGLFSLFLFTFCPNFLGHSCLVTTDVPFTTFFIITLYYLWKFFEKDNKKYLIFSGVFLGISISTKFTGIIILPFIIILLILLEIKDNFKKRFKDNFLIFLISFIVIPFFILLFTYRIYGFKNFLLGIKLIIFETTQRGHLSFLNGQFSITGWRYYFLFAFLYKTPISFLILLFFSIFLSLKIEKKERFLVLPAIIYFIFSSLSKKQIGIRYILPFYALIYIYCARIFIYHHKLKLNKIIKNYIFTFLFLWYAFSSLKIHPNYIAYFNEICGGPENGWKYLIDSNIDWGQDLKGLKKYLQKEGNPEILLNYFGSVLPETYGLIYEPFFYPLFLNIPQEYYRLNSEFPEKEYLAISVNYLQGLVYNDHKIFDWLKEIKPKTKIGYSIFVYDITEDINLRTKIYEMFKKYGFIRQAERQKKIIERLKNK